MPVVPTFDRVGPAAAAGSVASTHITVDNREMIDMTEPQVWVLVAAFSTAIFGMLALQGVSFNRVLKSSMDGLRTSIDALREATDLKFVALEARFEARFTTLDGKIDALDGRVGALEGKVDALDRDVQALTRHVFGSDPR